MIVDVHAHFWPEISVFTPEAVAQAERARGGPVNLVTDYDNYWSNAPHDTRVILFGGKARNAGIWLEDDAVAEMAASNPCRYIGFLSIDLTQPRWREDLERSHQDLKLRGVKLLPMYAGFRPDDPQYADFWRYVSRHRLPVLLHTGTTFIAQAPLRCTLPRHLDEVAIRFPEVTIIMAHLGHPYEGEAIAVARKHPNVYTDISALHYRPWQLFHSLMLATEYKIWPKILFGTDYPFTTVNETLAGLDRLCSMNISGFTLPREEVEAMIHRDTLGILFG